jgi:hypothetical protein
MVRGATTRASSSEAKAAERNKTRQEQAGKFGVFTMTPPGIAATSLEKRRREPVRQSILLNFIKHQYY